MRFYVICVFYFYLFPAEVIKTCSRADCGHVKTRDSPWQRLSTNRTFPLFLSCGTSHFVLRASLVDDLTTHSTSCGGPGCRHGNVAGLKSSMCAPCRIRSTFSSSLQLNIYLLTISTLCICCHVRKRDNPWQMLSPNRSSPSLPSWGVSPSVLRAQLVGDLTKPSCS